MKKQALVDDAMQESSHVETVQPVTDLPVFQYAPGRLGRDAGIDPKRAVRNVIRRWRLLIGFILVGAVLGWLSAAVAEESDTAPIEVDHYQASHVLVLDSNVPAMQTTLSVRNLNTLAKRITVGDVPAAVARKVGLAPTEAATQVRVVIRSDSESMDIITIAETPAIAEQLGDAYAEELFAYLNDEAERFAEEAVSSARDRLAEADANLAAVRSDLAAARAAEDEEAIALLEQDEQQFLSARIFANAALLDARSDGVPVVPLETLKAAAGNATVITSSRYDELVERAGLGDNVEMLFGDEVESTSSSGALSAVSSRLPTGAGARIGSGAALGLLAAVMAIVLLNRLDNRVRSKRQVESFLDLPVIAEVPAVTRAQRRRTEMLSRENPRSRFAEQYRALASTIGYARRARPRRRSQVVLVTSPGPAEGKTTTVANLGAMLAEAGETVLLINCDFRRPRLHLHMGAEDKPLDLNATEIPEVDMISNVVADANVPPTEVVTEQRKIIEQAREVYDLIVIDTAPLLATNDAVDLLDLVDDVILVLRAGKTTLHAADRAAEILERRRSHVLGIAISGIDARSSDDYYYYYGSYYDDRGPDPTESKRNRFWFRRGAPDQPDSTDNGVIDITSPDVELEVDDDVPDLDDVEVARTAPVGLLVPEQPVTIRRHVRDTAVQARLDDEHRMELERREKMKRTIELEYERDLRRIQEERRAAERAKRTIPPANVDDSASP